MEPCTGSGCREDSVRLENVIPPKGSCFFQDVKIEKEAQISKWKACDIFVLVAPIVGSLTFRSRRLTKFNVGLFDWLLSVTHRVSQLGIASSRTSLTSIYMHDVGPKVGTCGVFLSVLFRIFVDSVDDRTLR